MPFGVGGVGVNVCSGVGVNVRPAACSVQDGHRIVVHLEISLDPADFIRMRRNMTRDAWYLPGGDPPRQIDDTLGRGVPHDEETQIGDGVNGVGLSVVDLVRQPRG